MSRLRTVLLAVVCVALGAVGNHYLRAPAAAPVKYVMPGREAETVKPLTQAEQEELDAAFEARKAERYSEAAEKFAELGRKHPNWGMMEVEVGRTQYYQGELLKSWGTFRAAIDRGLVPAEARFMLALAFAQGQHFPEAEAMFAQASALDPGRADIQYFWAECLHRQGKTLAAAAHFHSALVSNQYETAEGLYRVKWWLCLLENDQENATGLNAEIDAALARPSPPMEAFFAAAARDVKAKDYGAAAGLLLRARRRTDPKIFPIIVGDPFFAPASARPELAAFFRPPTPPPASPEASKAAGSPEPSASPAKPANP